MRHLPGLWSDFCFICLLILKALRSAFYSLEQINNPLVNKTCKLCCIHCYSHLTYCMGRVYSNFTICLKAGWFQDGSLKKKKMETLQGIVHWCLLLSFMERGPGMMRSWWMTLSRTFFPTCVCFSTFILALFQVYLPFDTFLFFALLASPLSCL